MTYLLSWCSGGKWEGNTVYIASLGLARTTQKNHSSKKTQTKRLKKKERKGGRKEEEKRKQEEAKKHRFMRGMNNHHVALPSGHPESLCLVCRVRVLFSGLRS